MGEDGGVVFVRLEGDYGMLEDHCFAYLARERTGWTKLDTLL